MKIASFSLRLTKAMEDANISRSELEARTGIPRQLLYKYIKGISEPRNDNVKKLAIALQVDEAYLRGFDVDKKGNAKPKFNDVRKNHKEVKEINDAIGEAMKMLRTKREKSINDIAVMLDRKPTTIIDFENGTELIPSITVMRMCYLLEYDISEFYQDVLYFYKNFHKNKKD